VIFGYGNPSRGDDALGPVLLERAEAWADAHPGGDLDLVGDFQLQIEHAEDLRGRAVALFLDADASCAPPFLFRTVAPSKDDSYTTHELSPESVLQVFATIAGHEPPPAFVLSVRGERFDLGEPLSPEAEAHAEAAWALLEALLVDPRPEAWATRVT
jgi:hydrogenase maturation protease